MGDLNRGFNLDAYGGFRDKVAGDSSAGIREKVAVAEWVQGEESTVNIGGKEITIGSDDGLNMMEVLLASLAACDTAVVGLHASYMGLKVNSLRHRTQRRIQRRFIRRCPGCLRFWLQQSDHEDSFGRARCYT